MRISDWSSDVCSSDLGKPRHRIVHGKIVKAVEAGADAAEQPVQRIDKLGKLLALALVEGDVHFAFGGRADPHDQPVYCPGGQIGRASCRERSVSVRVDLGGRRILKKNKTNSHLSQVYTTVLTT